MTYENYLEVTRNEEEKANKKSRTNELTRERNKVVSFEENVLKLLNEADDLVYEAEKENKMILKESSVSGRDCTILKIFYQFNIILFKITI